MMAVAAPTRITVGTGVRARGSDAIVFDTGQPKAPPKTRVFVQVTDFDWVPINGEAAVVELNAGATVADLNAVLAAQPGLLGRTSLPANWPVRIGEERKEAPDERVLRDGAKILKHDP